LGEAIQKGSAVYIRYRDQLPFKDTPDAVEEATERETMGWLTQEIGDFVCIQHDRTVESFQYSSGSANGIVLRKSCILEIHAICEKGERLKAASTVHH